eukprot:COSAG06_NODE_9044_length_2003_cov_11.120210_2_plen_101_part_00
MEILTTDCPFEGSPCAGSTRPGYAKTAVRKRLFREAILCYRPIGICQDRLGTNIGKCFKQMLLQEHRGLADSQQAQTLTNFEFYRGLREVRNATFCAIYI